MSIIFRYIKSERPEKSKPTETSSYGKSFDSDLNDCLSQYLNVEAAIMGNKQQQNNNPNMSINAFPEPKPPPQQQQQQQQPPPKSSPFLKPKLPTPILTTTTSIDGVFSGKKIKIVYLYT